MELRTLRYFLTVIQEGSITNASKRLHITQPTLSRQLSDLERELGRPLLNRVHTGITLTEYGVMLARYAESIIALTDKAEADIKLLSQTVSGSVHIACGETSAVEQIADAMIATRQKYPEITFELYSGTTSDLTDGFVRGHYDFLLECDVQPHENMNMLLLDHRDQWGAIVRRDDPLASLAYVRPEDLIGRTLMVSRQGMKTNILRSWLSPVLDAVDIGVHYSLAINTKFLARKGVGVVITYENLITSDTGNTYDTTSDLTFIPLDPPLEAQHSLLWKKALLSRQAQAFLDILQAQAH